MVSINEFLYHTHKTVIEVCRENGLKYHNEEGKPPEWYTTLDQCSSCGIWDYPYNLKLDLDCNPICKNCEEAYGL